VQFFYIITSRLLVRVHWIQICYRSFTSRSAATPVVKVRVTEALKIARFFPIMTASPLICSARGGCLMMVAWRSKLWQMNVYGGRTNWDAISARLDQRLTAYDLWLRRRQQTHRTNCCTMNPLLFCLEPGHNTGSAHIQLWPETRPEPIRPDHNHWTGDPWPGSRSVLYAMSSFVRLSGLSIRDHRSRLLFTFRILHITLRKHWQATVTVRECCQTISTTSARLRHVKYLPDFDDCPQIRIMKMKIKILA